MLRDRPVHRWFVFPHSFTDDIVRSLAREWNLGTYDMLLDPFVGAGTTVLAAKQLGVPACGFDLSPLAVLTTRVKTSEYDLEQLEQLWKRIRRRIRVRSGNGEAELYAELVRNALPGKKLPTFHGAKEIIEGLEATAEIRDFFKLALLAQIPKFSKAVPTGGWLSWRSNRRPAASVPVELERTVQSMLADLRSMSQPRTGIWLGHVADARRLPVKNESCAAVITSPPYPNRHDYTRVFGVELMFGFLDWEGTRRLRYQMFHSHPEARPDRPATGDYEEPPFIAKAIRRIATYRERTRIVEMLHGYFLDLFHTLSEVSRVLKCGGHAAFVVGNAQYDGVPVEVDKAVAHIGEQTELNCTEIRVVRERGNSAQQMRIYGKKPSRESIVIFEK